MAWYGGESLFRPGDDHAGGGQAVDGIVVEPGFAEDRARIAAEGRGGALRTQRRCAELDRRRDDRVAAHQLVIEVDHVAVGADLLMVDDLLAQLVGRQGDAGLAKSCQPVSRRPGAEGGGEAVR